MTRRPSPGPGWTVLVTGASSGLGRALALELAQAGCSLVLTGRNPDRLAETAQAARAEGSPEVDWFEADLSLPDGVDSVLCRLGALERPIDALVNNAGSGWSGPWREADTATDRRLIQLLVDTPLALTRALVGDWRARGRGALMNIASTGAFQPGPLTSVYYASKAFLMNWSVALAREERRWLTVTTVCPGALATGFARAAGKRDVPGAPGPERTARLAVAAWKKNRGLVVPGFGNKVLAVASRWAPPTLTAAVVEALQAKVRRGR